MCLGQRPYLYTVWSTGAFRGNIVFQCPPKHLLQLDVTAPICGLFCLNKSASFQVSVEVNYFQFQRKREILLWPCNFLIKQMWAHKHPLGSYGKFNQ